MKIRFMKIGFFVVLLLTLFVFLVMGDNGEFDYSEIHPYLYDITLLVPDANYFIVGDGSDWIRETGSTARTSLGLGEFNTLTDNSIANALHRHTELVASDGSPDPALSVDEVGRVGMGTSDPEGSLELRTGNSIMRIRDTGDTATATTSYIEFGGTTTGSWNRTGYVGDASSEDTHIRLRAEDSDLILGDSSGASVLTLSGGNVTITGTLGAGAITGTSLTIPTTGEINFRDTDISIGSTLFDGTLDMSADISIDMFYDNADVGDGVDGQSLNINRRAAEGDDHISLYVDKDRKGLIGFSNDDDLLQLAANALTVAGTVDWSGGSSANANSAYTHIGESGASHTYIDQAVTIASSPTLQGLTINHPTLSQINLKEGASAKWRLGYDANNNILFWRDEANGNTVFSMEDAAPTSSIYIKSDGTIGFGTSLSTAHLTILTPAGAGETARESILKANVSDAGNDTFGIGNGTSTVNVFAPIFYGLVTSNSAHVPLTFRGFVLPANDASDSSATGLVSFQAFRTDSATDPANGAFSNAVNRKLFTWGTQSDQTLIVIPANKNVGIGVADPHSKLEVNGAISSNTRTFSTAGPTDDVDVANINTLFIDSASNNVTIGGFANGVDGQVLYITRISAVNDVTIEHNEGGATQPILLHKGADETLSAEFGGWMFVCHGGVDWHDLSHAKHVI